MSLEQYYAKIKKGFKSDVERETGKRLHIIYRSCQELFGKDEPPHNLECPHREDAVAFLEFKYGTVDFERGTAFSCKIIPSLPRRHSRLQKEPKIDLITIWQNPEKYDAIVEHDLNEFKKRVIDLLRNS